MDFRNKFHVLDCESGDKPNPLALDRSHIEEMSVLEETFSPAALQMVSDWIREVTSR